MNEFNKDIADFLASSEPLPTKIRTLLNTQLQLFLNMVLKAEFKAFLGYDPYERTNSNDARNGSYFRKLDTMVGPIYLEIPRDRNNEFHQQLIAPYRRRVEDLETTVITLFSKGVTARQIGELMGQMYGGSYCPTTISNITKDVQASVDEFHQRVVAEHYTALFLDATYIPFKRDNSIEKEAVYVAMGITPMGVKEVIDFRIEPKENSLIWEELLNDLKERGLTQVDLIVADGVVKSLQNTVVESFPEAKFQRCWVHIQRNVYGKVRRKDAQAVADDLKTVYKADNKQEAKENLANFIETWGEIYPSLKKMFQDDSQLFAFYDFPKQIRRSLYTNNGVESFNKELKKMMKQKMQFPTLDSVERFIVTVVLEYNEKRENRVMRGFREVRDTLDSL